MKLKNEEWPMRRDDTEAQAWFRALGLTEVRRSPAHDAWCNLVSTAVRAMTRVRRHRAMPDGTIPPAPEEWVNVVQRQWPEIWQKPPRLPPGWCDMMVAMSGQLAREGQGVSVIDAFEDYVRGDMTLRIVEHVASDTANVYAYISLHVCRECGAPGQVRNLRVRTAVLCDRCAP